MMWTGGEGPVIETGGNRLVMEAGEAKIIKMPKPIEISVSYRGIV